MPTRPQTLATRLALLMPVLLSVSGCARASTAAGHTESPDSMTALDSIFSAYDQPNIPGASVLVVKDGRVVASRSYGLADVGSGTAADEHTNYRLASLSKQFTATAIMLLARDGRLRYDDRLTDLLPGVPAFARGVSIRHLLTHTSGLWDYEDFVPDSQTVQVKDRDVLASLGRADSLYFAPGSAYRYSNTGYALLALIVERVSGQPFARFLHDRVFTPVGMTATVAYEAGISTVPSRALGYTLRGSRIVASDQSSTSAVLGDGGIYSSLHDLIAWDRALDAGTLLRLDELRTAWTPMTLTDGTVTRYGFGWFVDRENDALRLSHHGETSGFTNFILKYPDRRLTVIILTNRRGGAPWDLAARVAALPEFAAAHSPPE
jgi:CubicO group peptidase (beta-lactamase class C family)